MVLFMTNSEEERAERARFIRRVRGAKIVNPDARLTAIFFGGKLIIVPKCLQGFARLLLELVVEGNYN